MKYFIFLLFLIKSCSCYGSSLDEKRYWPGFDYGYIPTKDDALHHHHEDEYKHDDHKDYIVRPCPKYDEDCIRQVLMVNFGCLPGQGHISDPYYVKKMPVYVPSSNISAVLYDIQLKGISYGKVKEFYINKKTDTLVLEVEFEKFAIHSAKSVVNFYRKGKEPEVTTDYSAGDYEQLSFTLTIQNIHDMSSYESHVFASFSSLLITAGPELEKTEGFMSVKKNMVVTGQEVMVTQAPAYMATYLRHKICDLRNYI